MFNLISFFLVVIFILGGGSSSFAANKDKPKPIRSSKATPLSPEAYDAFKKGEEAVNLKDWNLAVEYFTKAQSKAETDTDILKNLGLSHLKAGHELPAIAWLSAYLEVSPNAPDSEKVKDTIRKLEVGVRSKINKVISDADNIEESLTDCTRGYFNPICDPIVGELLYAGDIRKAREYRNREYRDKITSLEGKSCDSNSWRVCYNPQYWDWKYVTGGCSDSIIAAHEIKLHYVPMLDKWIELAKGVSLNDPLSNFNKKIDLLKEKDPCDVPSEMRYVAEPIRKILLKIDAINNNPPTNLSQEALEWAYT